MVVTPRYGDVGMVVWGGEQGQGCAVLAKRGHRVTVVMPRYGEVTVIVGGRSRGRKMHAKRGRRVHGCDTKVWGGSCA